MIQDVENFLSLYEAVKKECRLSRQKKVLIFVSVLEADSTCAAKILMNILEKDDVQFSVYPISSYKDLKNTMTRLEISSGAGDLDLTNIFLINLGAGEDLVAFLDLHESTRLIVVDCHRPIHHNLAHEEDNRAVVISYSEDVHSFDEGGLPEPDGESEAELDNEEDQEQDEDHQEKRQRRSLEIEGQQHLESRREQRKKRAKEIRKRRVEYYRRGKYWGRPASLCMLHLAQSLQKEDKKLLWLAAVALADHLVHQRITLERYTACAHSLQDQITASGEPEEGRIALSYEDANGNQTSTTIKNPAMRIETVEDFQFPLLRTWNLYDSMLHSPFVALRLHTYTEKGRKKLEHLFARMGFTLEDCKIDFGTLSSKFVSMLKQRLQEKAPDLGEVWHSSFLLHANYKTLSATDAAYAATALLENHSQPMGKMISPTDAFWAAAVALDPGSRDPMDKGVELAKSVQRAILKESGVLIANKLVRNMSRVFLTVKLSNGNVDSQHIFKQPMALVKLGIFLRDRQAWGTGTEKAIVVVGPGDEQRRCQVVCVPIKPSLTDCEGNWIPLLLHKAAEEARSSAEIDNLNPSIALVPEEEVEILLHEMAAQAPLLARSLPHEA